MTAENFSLLLQVLGAILIGYSAIYFPLRINAWVEGRPWHDNKKSRTGGNQCGHRR